MYNSYLGQQQPQGQQGYQPQYQLPQQTGYSQPLQQQPQQLQQGQQQLPPQQFQQPPQFLQNQATGYGFQSPSIQPGQYGVPPVPAIPSQYAQQTPQIGLQQTGYQPQQFQPQQQHIQQQPPPPPAVSTPTGHSRKTSTAMGTSARIPNVRLTFLTTQDQIKFEQLFRSAVGGEQALEGAKARDILLRSKLSPDVLSQIWHLSDTTKSGKLLFPEFALAMYLCNLKLTGKDLPDKIPEKIMNEVSSMVDIISFAIPDSAPARETPRSNVPDFQVTAAPATQTPPAQPPQQSNIQTLSSLGPQPTGYTPTGFGSLSAQSTGFPGRSSPQQGYTPQQTGFQPQTATPTLGLPSQLTGMPLSGGLAAPGIPALQSQPTGRPGQWGFVNAPAGSMAGIEALQNQLMPQPGREGGFSSTGLTGSANVPWAVTKDEKTIYDGIFQAWDGIGRGFIGGDTAIEVFRQSGLPRSDLERIWTLSDPGNKGKLDRDEFAVALHLIYRRLNGYDIPVRLPPELIPPSSRAFANAAGQVKSFLRNDITARQKVGLTPQATGYNKARSFRDDPVAQYGKKDAVVYRFNDNEVGYTSSARRRGGGGQSRTSSIGTRSPSPPVEVSKDQEIQRLRKEIREKQILLDAVDIRDEASHDDDSALERRDRDDADDLYKQIRRIQEEIDSLPNSSSRGLDSAAEKRAMRRQLQSLSDRLPKTASDVRETERRISDAKLRLFRMKDAKEHPGTSIQGTGPNGEVTEGDRRKAKANAMLQARMAQLTGKPVPATNDDFDGAARRLAEETERVKREREDNERMIRGIEESAEQLKEGLERSLKEDGPGVQGDHERRRWEEAIGVEDEVRDFIFDLQRQSREIKAKPTSPVRRDAAPPASSSPQAQSSSPAPRSTASPSSATSYSNFKTAEERAAWVKQQAQQRMNERLAALGIRPASKPQSTFPPEPEPQPQTSTNGFASSDSQRAQEETARKQREEQDRVRREQEQAQRAKQEEQQRQEALKLQQQKEEEARLKAEQENQERRRREIEEQERREEEELLREKAAQEERVKALQREVEAGKARKAREAEEAKQREAQKQMSQREERLKAMRAEVEARKEEERRLQMEREALEREIAEPPQPPPPAVAEPIPAPVQEKALASPPPREPSSSPSMPKTETNPFLRKDNAPAQPAATSSDSTNPFFRMAAEQPAKTSTPATKPAPITTRPRANSDDWDLVPSDQEEGSDDESAPAGKRAVDLASMLFGGMAVPTRVLESPTPSSTPTSSRPVAEPEEPAPTAPPVAPPPPAATNPPAPPAPPSPPVARAPSPPQATYATASDFHPSQPVLPPPPPFGSPPPPPASFSSYDMGEDYFDEPSSQPPPAPQSIPPPPPMAPSAPPPPPPPAFGSSPPPPPFGAPPPPPSAVPQQPSYDAPAAPPPPPMGAPPAPPPPSFGGPPPPPPVMGSPPPPPSFSSPPAAPAPASGGGLSGALLSSIQKGKALKRVQTVDKSGPPSAGRVLN